MHSEIPFFAPSLAILVCTLSLPFFLFPRASAIFLGPSLVKFAPIYSKNRSSPTNIHKYLHTDSPHSLRALSYFSSYSVFPLIAAHHELARTHPKQPPCVVVRKVRGACRRARSKHKQGQNLTDDELQRRRRPSSRESPIKLNTGWGCPMKCCPNGPFH